MYVPFVDLKSQYHSIKTEVDGAINAVFGSGVFIGGEFVDSFSKEFAAKVGVNHCLPVGNGTDALFIIMKMMGIGPGDEVITAVNGWYSCAESIVRCGATPVFADIEEEYFTIDPVDINRKITARTKAIMPIHLFGQACNMSAIMTLAKEYNLKVIEDCAQAHFSMFNDQMLGSFGDAAAFSFYPTKNMGANGDAGAIVTNDKSLAQKCKAFANHGSLEKDVHLMSGINSRMDPLQAAILSVKLKHIDDWNRIRNSYAHKYSLAFEGIDVIRLPRTRAGSYHTFHQFVIKHKQRDILKETLRKEGVVTHLHYPMLLPFIEPFKYLGYDINDFPIAKNFTNKILSLPIYPEMRNEQLSFVIQALRKLTKHFRE